jgi:hypothetical protein
MGLGRMTSFNYSCGPTKNQHKVVSALTTLLVLGQTIGNSDLEDSAWLRLGETITFPFIVYYVPFHEAHIQMTFCPGTPK